jgi:pyruvate/2-oxoglutarate/acetoin dehydrogenase E1 component
MIDTLLDEQSILGLAIGMAQNGFVPLPEIQFLAYLHNAEDQLRGEAATLPFFSPTANIRTRWCCASRVLAIRRASAAISTMTIPSPCCATFRA